MAVYLFLFVLISYTWTFYEQKLHVIHRFCSIKKKDVSSFSLFPQQKRCPAAAMTVLHWRKIHCTSFESISYSTSNLTATYCLDLKFCLRSRDDWFSGKKTCLLNLQYLNRLRTVVNLKKLSIDFKKKEFETEQSWKQELRNTTADTLSHQLCRTKHQWTWNVKNIRRD